MCRVKASIHTVTVFIMLLKSIGIVDKECPKAFFSACRTRVDIQVSFGALIPQALYDSGSSGHY